MPNLQIPESVNLIEARKDYRTHMQRCQALLELLPDDMRMVRQNAGFHECTSAIGALGAIIKSKQPKLLEVGVWKGVTTSFFLEQSGASAKAFGLDIFQFRNQEVETAHLLAELDLLDQSMIFKCPSDQIPLEIINEGPSFDIVHVDGSHEFRDVIKDVLLYFHFLKPGGWMIVDDYFDPVHSPDVKPAIDLIIANKLLASDNNGQPEGFTNYWLQKL